MFTCLHVYVFATAVVKGSTHFCMSHIELFFEISGQPPTSQIFLGPLENVPEELGSAGNNLPFRIQFSPVPDDDNNEIPAGGGFFCTEASDQLSELSKLSEMSNQSGACWDNSSFPNAWEVQRADTFPRDLSYCLPKLLDTEVSQIHVILS